MGSTDLEQKVVRSEEAIHEDAVLISSANVCRAVLGLKLGVPESCHFTHPLNSKSSVYPL